MPETPWQRRVRRTLFLIGGASSVYFFFSYVGARMRDARVRALKERRERETLKAHFTSLLSTISFTLYALLPNLEPQLFAAYPVEATSQALQAKANPPVPVTSQPPSTPPRQVGAPVVQTTPASFTAAGPPVNYGPADGETLQGLGSPTDTGTTTSTPADSLLLDGEGPSAEGYSTEDPSAVVPPQPPTHSHAPGTMADSVMSMATSTDFSDAGHPPAESWASEFSRNSDDADDMLTASTTSQSISLPPTDTSSAAPSPRSEISRFDSSPARAPDTDNDAAADPRSKKELWRDLKVQSLTRAFATAYLVPMLYLLTSSQLSILSRTRYLSDVKESHALRELESTPPRKSSSSWFPLDTIEAYTAPLASWLRGVPPPSEAETASALSVREADLDQARTDAERLFLTYSWWLLNVGWKTLATRVEGAVTRVFGGLGLKRELQPDAWRALVREIRAQVENDTDLSQHQGHHHGHHVPFDFGAVLLPPASLPEVYDDCPLPQRAEGYLKALLQQSAEHVSSPDARALIDRGVTAMLENLSSHVDPPKRVADMLPELNRWSRSVWEGIPDGGVETLLALPEFEAFTALIFGDWAPRE